MKKPVKIVLWIVGALVALLLLVLVTLPWWICPVIRGVANSAVPDITKTTFALGEFDIGFTAWSLHVGGVRLGNPSGYKPDEAFRLGSFDIVLDSEGTTNDIVHVKSIAIKDVYLSYSSEANTNNFQRIADNAKAALELDGEKAAESTAADGTDAAPADGAGASNLRVIVDRLEIAGVTLQFSSLAIPIPVTIVLTDIGRESGGVSWKELWHDVRKAVLKAGGNGLGALKNLGVSGLDLGNQGLQTGMEGVKDVGAALKNLDVDAAKDAADKARKQLKDVGKSLKSLFK